MELVGAGKIKNSWGVVLSGEDGKLLAWVDHNHDGLITFAEDFHPDKLKNLIESKETSRGIDLMFAEIWNLRQRVQELESEKL